MAGLAPAAARPHLFALYAFSLTVARVLTSLLGAGWVVHPAAGMLLAFLIGWMDGGTRRWERHLPMLGVALLSAAAFMFLGAGWLQFPLAVILIITAFSSLANLGRGGKPGASRPP